MAIHFHEEDLPADVAFRRRADRGRHRGDGPRSRPRPAVPGAIVRRQGRRASRPVRGAAATIRRPTSRRCSAIPNRLKLYHFARFDVGIMQRLSRDHGRAALLHPHRLAAGPHLHRPPRPQGPGQGAARTSTCRSSSRPATGARDELSDAQREYAASDVRYLHALKEKLDERLEREDRVALAQACFDFLPTRALLDLAGWAEQDIFAHDG